MKNYTVTSVGSLNGISSHATGINNRTQIVGLSGYGPYSPAHYHAYFWQTGVMDDLGDLGALWCSAVAVSDRGQAVGYAEFPGESRALFYDNGQMVDIGPKISHVMSVASDINEKGQVVGGAVFAPYDNSEGQHAFLYDSEAGNLTDLGTLPGRDFSVATAVNDNGQVVGNSRHFYTADSHPFLYKDGKMLDLTPNAPGVAYDINNGGQVLGYALPQGMFIFADEKLRYLGTLMRGVALNEVGQIVGYGVDRGGSRYAMIYDEDSAADLNTLIPSNSGWYLKWANDINDKGQIVGVGSYNNGFSKAVLLTPTNKFLQPFDPNDIEILLGVTKYGREKILPDGSLQPVDPWPGIREILSPILREILVGATVFSAAALLENPELRREMERLARQFLAEASKNSPT